MSISRKKSYRKTSTGSGKNFIGDVTIDDFANSSRTHARLKKAAINVSSEVQHKEITEDKVWNETHSPDTDNSKKSSKGTLMSQTKYIEGTASKPSQMEEEEGIDYPLDVWFIISEYISPEAVGKFARICKSSYHVTTTGKFWLHLYKTYYKPVPGLPERLKPHFMVRMHGLRACVIRTLHHTYFASKRDVDSSIRLPLFHSFEQDEPHSLVKRKCCLMWHKKGKLLCYFYFKLKEVPKSTRNSIKEKPKVNGRKTEFLEMLEDVAVNPEEGCKLLRVACSRYSLLPPVTGLILQKVSVTLMQGFKNNRLQLGFGTSDVPNTLTHQVILNDVVKWQVLNWWHPSYPHEDKLTTIELPYSDFWDENLT
nr:transmembrane protein 183-like isoform X2 [Nomia melanderi]